MGSDSRAFAGSTDLYVVDHGPTSDLMFWNKFARFLRETSSRNMLVLGSGEKTEGMLGGRSVVRRERGALQFGDDQRATYERGMREELHTVTSRLTDEGISSVGFTGLDRKLLIVENKSDMRVRVGKRGMKSLLTWVGKGVLSVVSSAALGPGGAPLDIHPLEAALTLKHGLEKREKTGHDVRVIVVLQRVTEIVRHHLVTEKSDSIKYADAEQVLAERTLVSGAMTSGEDIYLAHPDLPMSRCPALLVNRS